VREQLWGERRQADDAAESDHSSLVDEMAKAGLDASEVLAASRDGQVDEQQPTGERVRRLARRQRRQSLSHDIKLERVPQAKGSLDDADLFGWRTGRSWARVRDSSTTRRRSLVQEMLQAGPFHLPGMERGKDTTRAANEEEELEEEVTVELKRPARRAVRFTPSEKPRTNQLMVPPPLKALATPRLHHTPQPQAVLGALRQHMQSKAGVSVSTSWLRLVEGGPVGLYSLQLTSKPESPTVILLQSHPDGRFLHIRPSVLTFTPENALVPQVARIAVLDDGRPTGFDRGLIVHTSLSADPQYGPSLPIAPVRVFVVDSDSCRVHVCGVNSGGRVGPTPDMGHVSGLCLKDVTPVPVPMVPIPGSAVLAMVISNTAEGVTGGIDSLAVQQAARDALNPPKPRRLADARSDDSLDLFVGVQHEPTSTPRNASRPSSARRIVTPAASTRQGSPRRPQSARPLGRTPVLSDSAPVHDEGRFSPSEDGSGGSEPDHDGAVHARACVEADSLVSRLVGLGVGRLGRTLVWSGSATEQVLLAAALCGADALGSIGLVGTQELVAEWWDLVMGKSKVADHSSWVLRLFGSVSLAPWMEDASLTAQLTGLDVSPSELAAAVGGNVRDPKWTAVLTVKPPDDPDGSDSDETAALTDTTRRFRAHSAVEAAVMGHGAVPEGGADAKPSVDPEVWAAMVGGFAGWSPEQIASAKRHRHGRTSAGGGDVSLPGVRSTASSPSPDASRVSPTGPGLSDAAARVAAKFLDAFLTTTSASPPRESAPTDGEASWERPDLRSSSPARPPPTSEPVTAPRPPPVTPTILFSPREPAKLAPSRSPRAELAVQRWQLAAATVLQSVSGGTEKRSAIQTALKGPATRTPSPSGRHSMGAQWLASARKARSPRGADEEDRSLHAASPRAIVGASYQALRRHLRQNVRPRLSLTSTDGGLSDSASVASELSMDDAQLKSATQALRLRGKRYRAAQRGRTVDDSGHTHQRVSTLPMTTRKLKTAQDLGFESSKKLPSDQRGSTLQLGVSGTQRRTSITKASPRDSMSLTKASRRESLSNMLATNNELHRSSVPGRSTVKSLNGASIIAERALVLASQRDAALGGGHRAASELQTTLRSSLTERWRIVDEASNGLVETHGQYVKALRYAASTAHEGAGPVLTLGRSTLETNPLTVAATAAARAKLVDADAEEGAKRGKGRRFGDSQRAPGGRQSLELRRMHGTLGWEWDSDSEEEEDGQNRGETSVRIAVTEREVLETARRNALARVRQAREAEYLGKVSGTQRAQQRSWRVSEYKRTKRESSAPPNPMETIHQWFADIVDPSLDPSSVSHAASGVGHTLLTVAGGVLFALGDHSKGQCGVGTSTGSCRLPTLVPALCKIPVVKVAAGHSHSVIVTSEGLAFTFGEGATGALGLGCLPSKEALERVGASKAATNAASLVAARGLGGSWGRASPLDERPCLKPTNALLAMPECPVPTTLGMPGSLAFQSFSVPMPVLGLVALGEKVIDVKAGAGFSLFLTASDAVYSCGRGESGQLGVGRRATQDLHKAHSWYPAAVLVQAALLQRADAKATVTDSSTAAASVNKSRREVASAKGPSQFFVPFPVRVWGLDGRGVFSIEAGAHTAAALGGAGEVWIWGGDKDGSLGLGRQKTAAQFLPCLLVMAMPAGEQDGVAAETVPAASPLRGDFSSLAPILMSSNKQPSFFREMKRLRTCRELSHTDMVVEMASRSESRAVSIALGRSHGVCVTQSGAVFCWGDNSSNQLFFPPAAGNRPRVRPALARALWRSGVRAASVSCGDSHSLIITDRGVVYAAGADETGACGAPSAVTSLRLADTIARAWEGRDWTKERSLSTADQDRKQAMSVAARAVSELYGQRVVSVAAGAFHSMLLCDGAPLSRQDDIVALAASQMRRNPPVIVESAAPVRREHANASSVRQRKPTPKAAATFRQRKPVSSSLTKTPQPATAGQQGLSDSTAELLELLNEIP
jgi:alpha-tubulin suppressor-like RCC1 family protein